MANSKRKQSFWPTIDDKETARQAARQGVWAAGFVAVVTAVVATIALSQNGNLPDGIPKIDAWAFWDAGIFAAIGWGIYKLSRVAAVAGLVLYIAEQIMLRVSNPRLGIGGLFVAALLVLAFINGVRGTFAYHQFQRASTADASTADAESEP